MTGIGCSTCLELFTSRCDVSTTPCGHAFHTNCVTQWLGTKQNNCPQCRKYCTLGQIRKLYFSEVEKEDQSDLVNDFNELLDENEKLTRALQKNKSSNRGAWSCQHPSHQKLFFFTLIGLNNHKKRCLKNDEIDLTK